MLVYSLQVFVKQAFDKNSYGAEELVLESWIGFQFARAHLVVDLRSLTQGTAGGI